MMKRKNYFLMGLGWLVFGAAVLTLMGLAVMFLWNWLIPAIFNGTEITLLQSIGIIALAKLLTGFHGFGRGHGWSKHGYYKKHQWKSRWEEKMANMTPEQKERFKKMYYDRCGWSRWEDSKKEVPKTEEANA